MTTWHRILALGTAFLIGLTHSPLVKSAQISSPDQIDIGISDSGILFVNGQFVAPPYQITPSEDVLLINGLTLIPRKQSRQRQEWHAERDGRSEQGPGRNRRRARATADDQEAMDEGVDARPGAPAVKRYMNSLVEILNGNTIVIAFDNQPVRGLSVASHQYEFMDLLLNKARTAEQVQAAARQAGSAAGEQLWINWLSDFQADPQLSALLNHYKAEIDAAEVRSLSQIAAAARLEQYSYPLTIAGMLLGVIAFGHMIQWVGRGLGERNGVTEDGQRSVVVALGLMMGMSVIDLTWTILAGQAGAMRELNPVAAPFVTSPMQLAMLKVFATTVGFGILYVWRHRSQIQHATWWMCMVCVLLTFRWVMFDSMLN
jgi:hypothetical protein